MYNQLETLQLSVQQLSESLIDGIVTFCLFRKRVLPKNPAEDQFEPGSGGQVSGYSYILEALVLYFCLSGSTCI